VGVVEYVSRMSSVRGKVVFITGGAAGVGAEVAHRLHAKGANLVLTDVDADLLARQRAELGTDRVLAITADVRDLAAMQAAAAAAVERVGGIDVVLANAGIEGRRRRVYCPRWVGVFRWLKPVLTLRPVEGPFIKGAATIVPKMDAEVAALGRSTSAHNEELDQD
jgi:NAD(P)-dependent dehydrogenase (short-subunit alcohol dehydrogenase family)